MSQFGSNNWFFSWEYIIFLLSFMSHKFLVESDTILFSVGTNLPRVFLNICSTSSFRSFLCTAPPIRSASCNLFNVTCDLMLANLQWNWQRWYALFWLSLILMHVWWSSGFGFLSFIAPPLPVVLCLVFLLLPRIRSFFSSGLFPAEMGFY